MGTQEVPWRKSKSKSSNRPNPSSNPNPSSPGPKPAPKVSIIGTNAFAITCNQPDSELFVYSFTPVSPTETVQLSSIPVGSATTAEPDLSTVPPDYHDITELFSKCVAEELPPHCPYDHTIEIPQDQVPPLSPLWPKTPVELEELCKYIDENLHKSFIRHLQSPCGAPILFVKKADGSLRLCVNYHGVNKITTKNRYPLPLIAEMLERMGRTKYFTKLDVRDGYHRLRMATGEEWKTVFKCRYGLFRYTVMPSGLCNAPGTFQHYMNDTFHEFLNDFLIIYLDDLLIYSDSLTEHKCHVRKVLERLCDAKLCLKLSQCQFHFEEVAFLGFLVGPQGI